MNNNKSSAALAEKIALILNSPNKKHDGLKDAIEEILCEVANQGNLAIYSPEVIAFTLPALLASVNEEYGRAIYQSLNLMLGSELVDEKTKSKLEAIHNKHWERGDVSESGLIDLSTINIGNEKMF